jgi:hypothetical protein
MALQSANDTSDSSNSTDDSFEENLYDDFAYELMIEEIEAALGNDTASFESLQDVYGNYDGYEVTVSLQSVEMVEVDETEVDDSNYDDSYDTYALVKVSYFTLDELKSLKDSGVLLGLWTWDEIANEFDNKTSEWGHEVENKTSHWESEADK